MRYKKIILLPLVAALSLIANYPALAQMPGQRYGEIRIRVFKSSQDSIEFSVLQKKIDEELARKQPRKLRVDSLTDQQMKMLAERVTYKTIYRPSRDYIVTDSLNADSDLAAVTRLSVFGKSALPAVVFRCINLEAIELVNTSIERLPDLSGLKRLKAIHIYNNRSKRRLKLSSNATVTNLTIHNQRPEGLPYSFKKFRALKMLDLAENALVKFPNGARRNKELAELSLQRNKLTLRNKIKRHPYLERLSLHNNEITRVPASIGNCKNLRKLNFNSNNISVVHANIGVLQNLEQLSFYKNALQAIPEGVYRISTLKEIDLFYNQLEAIDPAFTNWQNLHTLYLSHNKLVALPENIDALRNLEGLYVWDNRLGKLPESLGNVAGLKYLRVNGNYLKEVPLPLLKLFNLEEIDLSNNYLTEVPDGVFGLQRLKILAIANNPWDKQMLKVLPAKVEALRARDVNVHLSD